MIGTLECEQRMSFWHHVQPREELVDKQCLVDHLHVESLVRVEVEDKDSKFLDFKAIKVFLREILDKMSGDPLLPVPIDELKKLADASGNVGQAGDFTKPDSVKSVNEILGVDDCSAEYMVRYIHHQLYMYLVESGYGYRKVNVYFKETDNYSYRVREI